MSNSPQQTNCAAQRTPDCVTEVCLGSTVLTVCGYCKLDATETAVDKMAKVIETEAAAGLYRFKEAG